MSEELLTVKDVQRRLRISERTVFTLLRKGDLTGFKVSNAWRFRESDITNYEERQRRKAEELHGPKEEAEEVRQPLVDSAEFARTVIRARELVV